MRTLTERKMVMMWKMEMWKKALVQKVNGKK